jgi:hypothetical protein
MKNYNNYIRVKMFSSDCLQNLYEFVITSETEICGNLILQDGTYEMDPTVYVGTLDHKGRPMCLNPNRGTFYFHTHPLNSFAFPSKEDLLKVNNLQDTNGISYIATKWGIWAIQYVVQANYISFDKKGIDELMKSRWYGEFGEETRIDKSRGMHHGKNYNATIQSHIDNYIKRVQSIFNNQLHIEFNPWSFYNPDFECSSCPCGIGNDSCIGKPDAIHSLGKRKRKRNTRKRKPRRYSKK